MSRRTSTGHAQAIAKAGHWSNTGYASANPRTAQVGKYKATDHTRTASDNSLHVLRSHLFRLETELEQATVLGKVNRVRKLTSLIDRTSARMATVATQIARMPEPSPIMPVTRASQVRLERKPHKSKRWGQS